GSSDPAALADVRAAAHRLSVRLSRPVTAAFASAGEPALSQAVEQARVTPATRVALASYVLAPGFFHDRLTAAGADLVTAPLGADPDVAALVWHRYDRALATTQPLGDGRAGQAWTGSSRSSRTISPALASRVGPASAPTNISM
ncbi:MAG: sirohydrochlorin chelatase, partial [Nonomuraea sp.]|nr:sirohydrochlorin chelatase [Nonomuraea sp.]